MSLSRGGRGGPTKFLEKGTLSLSTEFFFDGFPKRSHVWDHFQPSQVESLNKCNMCGKKIPTNYPTMSAHLKKCKKALADCNECWIKARY